MNRWRSGALGVLAFAGLAALGLTGCGGGASGARSSAATASPRAELLARRMTLLLDATPASLDPAGRASPLGEELMWPVYTGLVSFRHAAGRAGAQVVAGLATGLPAASDGGRIYRLRLRRGLRFSDGRPVRASDFTATVERAISNPGDGAGRLLASLVRGAAPFAAARRGMDHDAAAKFAAGHVTSIAGIVADDATRVITIHLRRPFSAPTFDELLASPALGLVPADTPLRADPDDPPVGAGPYRFAHVRPGRSLTLERNPYWRALPGIPAAALGVDVRISRDRAADVLAVLNGVGDVLDPHDTIPARLSSEVRQRAPGRFSWLGDGPVEYVFLNPRRWPFSLRRARQAALAALDESALVRDAAGAVSPRCVFAPPVLSRPTERCASRPAAGAQLPRARTLVRRSGTLGAEIVLLAPRSQPARGWMIAEAAALRSIGYVAILRVVSDAEYRRAVAAPAMRPATGVASITAPVGAPWTLAWLAGDTAATTGWSAITRAVARRDDVFVIGDRRVPRFTSARIDRASMRLNPEFGLDLASLRLR